MRRKSQLEPDEEISKSAAKLRLLKTLHCTTKFESEAWKTGAQMVAGVDEVGRGCLFGPVVAAAVILDPNYRIRGLRDSKLLPEKKRDELSTRIKEHCIAWSIAAVDSARIDQINIYHASKLAMLEAVSGLPTKPDFLLIDAMVLDYPCAQKKIIHGDALSASIAAASIIAKVHRDAIIREWDPIYPAYGLASNKGYGTRKHVIALREIGPCPLHRQSFAPVWNTSTPQELSGFMLEDEGLNDES